jgi:O-antigen ligase
MTFRISHLQKTQFGIIAGLLFLLPITMGTIASTASAIFIVLFVMALIQPRQNWVPTEKYEWLLIILFIGTFAAVLLSFINADDMRMSVRRLERVLRIIGFIPIYFLLKSLPQRLARYFNYGIVVAGPIMLMVALFGEHEFHRADGAYNAILFGDYASLIAVICLVLALLGKDSKWLRLLAFISFLCASQAALMSETRGAYIAIPIAGMLVALFFVITSAASKRQLLLNLGALAITGIILTTLAINNPHLKPRLESTVSEFNGYISGNDTETSVGLRFQMWEASVRMWQKHPIIGSGLGDFSIDLQKQMDTGESKMTEHFGEAHSLYFEFLGTTGSLGFLMILLSMFLVPSYLFFRNIRQPGKDQTFIASMALVFISAFMVFAISQNWLGRSSITSVYFIGLALFLAEQYKLGRLHAANGKSSLAVE